MTELTIELTRNNLHTDDAKIEICQPLDDAKNNVKTSAVNSATVFLPYPTLDKKVDVQGFHAHWKAWRMKTLINPGLKNLNKSSLIQSSDFIFFIGQPHLQETGTTSRGTHS